MHTSSSGFLPSVPQLRGVLKCYFTHNKLQRSANIDLWNKQCYGKSIGGITDWIVGFWCQYG
jgi:hypothetical protein